MDNFAGHQHFHIMKSKGSDSCSKQPKENDMHEA
jgi:hypothetical protein